MIENAPVEDMQRFADNYRYISALDLNTLPAKAAKEGLQLRSNMRKAMLRMQRSAHLSDIATHPSMQKAGMGLPLIPLIFGTGALTWLARKYADSSDEYVARVTVIEQLIASGVSPEKAAEIVMGKDKWPAWKVALYSAGFTGAIIGGVAVWRKIRKK